MVLYKNITIVPNWPKKRQTSVTMIFLKWDSGGEGNAMNSGLSPNFDTKYPDSIGAEVMSIALIGPDEERRKAVSRALAECRGAEVREFSSYPTTLDDVPRLLRQHYDVIIIDLDSNREFALELVESICATDSATVMVYAEMTDRDRVFRSMRAGAREFLTPPFDHPPSENSPHKEDWRQAARVFRLQGRLRRHDYCLQFCDRSGPGI